MNFARRLKKKVAPARKHNFFSHALLEDQDDDGGGDGDDVLYGKKKAFKFLGMEVFCFGIIKNQPPMEGGEKEKKFCWCQFFLSPFFLVPILPLWTPNNEVD